MASDDENVWAYNLLEVRPDPEHKALTNDIEIDEVSWKTFIYSALKGLHGQFGVAIDTDIVKRQGLKAIARVQKEDLLVFKSSILAFSTNLSSIGYEDIDASIGIKLLDDDKENYYNDSSRAIDEINI